MDLEVADRTVAADGVVSLTLVAADGGALPPWDPGAHVGLALADGLTRQYSLCSDPRDLRSYRVAVLLEPSGGGGSRFVHDELRPGVRVEVREPRNHFPLLPATAYVFIAGGIGITPLLPMMAEAARRGAPFRLEYGGRTRSSMAFLDELAGYGDAVTVRPQDETGLLDLPTLLAEPEPGVAVYCCGPESLLAAVEQHTRSWPAGSLHVERFAAPAATPSAQPDRTFEVVLASSNELLEVPAGVPLLDVLEAHGADVMGDCREGTCGTCEVKVVEGEVDHRDFVLSDREREQNTVLMTCVSRAACPRLVLDL